MESYSSSNRLNCPSQSYEYSLTAKPAFAVLTHGRFQPISINTITPTKIMATTEEDCHDEFPFYLDLTTVLAPALE